MLNFLFLQTMEWKRALDIMPCITSRRAKSKSHCDLEHSLKGIDCSMSHDINWFVSTVSGHEYFRSTFKRMLKPTVLTIIIN